MGFMSAMAKMNNQKPKKDSKRQQELVGTKKPYIGCNNCHKTKVTLIKAMDSYYCKACFIKLNKEYYKG